MLEPKGGVDERTRVSSAKALEAAPTWAGEPPAAVQAPERGRQEPAPASEPAQLGRPWAMAAKLMAMYAAVRLLLMLADVVAAHVSYGGHLSGPFLAWDGFHYLDVAKSGYPPAHAGADASYGPAGFDPLFPSFIKLAASTGMPYVGAGLFVSLLGGAATALVFWRLAGAVVGEPAAANAALLFTVFPGLAMPWGGLYSESVGLAFAAGALLYATRGQWWWAGVLGSLAGLTNPMGLCVAFAALAMGVWQLAQRQRPSALLAAGIAPLPFLGFALWLGVRNNDLLYWWHYQKDQWGATIDWGTSLLRLLPHFWGSGWQGRGFMAWAGLVAIALGAVALWRAKLPVIINLYYVVVVAALLLSTQGPKARLLCWAFPALIAVAATLKAGARFVLTTAFAMLLPMVFLTFTTLGNIVAQP
jgi:hypothetical protein